MSLYTYIGTPNSNLVSTIQPLSKSQGKKIDCHRFVVSASKSFSALYTKPTLSLSIRTPFTEPMTTITCTHTFCFECIHQALHHAPLCPIDRSPLCELDLVPADPIIRSVRPQKKSFPIFYSDIHTDGRRTRSRMCTFWNLEMRLERAETVLGQAFKRRMQVWRGRMR